MGLSLSYFAWVREAMGRDVEQVTLPATVATIADLIAWLAQRDAAGAHAFADPARIRAARDGMMVTPADIIGDATDISLFPPVTGG